MAFHETMDQRGPVHAPPPKRQDGAGHRLANHLGYALLRFAVGGAIFLNHGLEKLTSPVDPEFLRDIQKAGVPEFFATYSGLAEGVCGLLLAIGLVTRPAAFLILVDMFVAAFLFRYSGEPHRFELASVYFLLSLSLVVGGGGRYSLDTPIARWREKSKGAKA